MVTDTDIHPQFSHPLPQRLGCREAQHAAIARLLVERTHATAQAVGPSLIRLGTCVPELAAGDREQTTGKRVAAWVEEHDRSDRTVQRAQQAPRLEGGEGVRDLARQTALRRVRQPWWIDGDDSVSALQI